MNVLTRYLKREQKKMPDNKITSANFKPLLTWKMQKEYTHWAVYQYDFSIGILGHFISKKFQFIDAGGNSGQLLNGAVITVLFTKAFPDSPAAESLRQRNDLYRWGKKMHVCNSGRIS